jgi:transglutaminase-like putative cysteine protease
MNAADAGARADRAAVLRVRHETRYRYETRVEVSYHIAYLLPRQDALQRVHACSLVIEPTPSYRAASTDAFGNERTFFALYSPHAQLVVRADSRVTPVARDEVIDAARSARCDEALDSLRYAARTPMLPAVQYTFASPFVPLHEQLGAYARPSFGRDRPLLQGAVELMQRIHADFDYEAGSTEVSTPLQSAFEQRRGVCQDFAHVMIGCLRSVGLPARYVSGYLLTTPAPGAPRLLGADASHAWVAVWCPRYGWVGLDPTNDVIASASHVTLATGRDYGDVMPLRGVIRGGGEHSVSVEVSVAPE